MGDVSSCFILHERVKFLSDLALKCKLWDNGYSGKDSLYFRPICSGVSLTGVKSIPPIVTSQITRSTEGRSIPETRIAGHELYLVFSSTQNQCVALFNHSNDRNSLYSDYKTRPHISINQNGESACFIVWLRFSHTDRAALVLKEHAFNVDICNDQTVLIKQCDF